MDTLTGKDLYLRHVDADGRSHIQQHRVWDADLFLASQQQALRDAAKPDKSGDPPKPVGRIEVATREQYEAQRGQR